MSTSGLPDPRTLLGDLAKTHLRASASPLPREGVTFGWQMTASALAALAMHLLHELDARDHQRAVEITTYYRGPFGDGPTTDELSWIRAHVAGPVGEDVTDWLEDAARAAADTEARQRPSADDLPAAWRQHPAPTGSST